MHDLLHKIYNNKIKEGVLDDDPHQRAILDKLSVLRHQFLLKRDTFLRLFRRPPSSAPRGLYLWGEVGRGKSLLMDLFIDSLDTPALQTCIRRVHFQDFMQEVHREVHQQTKAGATAPLQATVDLLLKNLKLLAFDEMQVNGIADAMLLNRLFRTMLEHGVTIIITSNKRPVDLYDDVFQRDAFLPFIKLVGDSFDIAEIGGGFDHRKGTPGSAERWFWPNDAQAQAAMDRLWSHQNPQANALLTLQTHGRSCEYLSDGARAVRVSFDNLCDKPHSAADYMALAEAVDFLVIDDIPEFGMPNRDAARRFMMLLDALYERDVAIAASAMRPIETLLVDSTILPEFSRTVSRVVALRKMPTNSDPAVQSDAAFSGSNVREL